MARKKVSAVPKAEAPMAPKIPDAPEVKEAPKAPIEQPVKASNKTSMVKIDPKDVIQLQKDGKLMKYDPNTGIGEVRETGLPTIWPSVG